MTAGYCDPDMRFNGACGMRGVSAPRSPDRGGCRPRRRIATVVFLALFPLVTGCAGQPDDTLSPITQGADVETATVDVDVAAGPSGSGEATGEEAGGEAIDDLMPAAGEAEEDLFLADDVNDPLEVPNRFIFAFNLTLDTFLLQPAAATYRFLIPGEARDSVRNALRNLRSPVILANDVFQGEMERAEITLMRFLINSTVGVLGLFDVAAEWGYPYHNEDFGQTLGTYDVGEGFYLVLPVFGPSSVRDGIGLAVDTFLDPLTYVATANDLETEFLIRPALEGIDTRSRNIETIEDLKRDSIDFYARVRSLYRQNRINEINNGNTTGMPSLPGMSEFNYDLEVDDEQLGSAD